MPFRLLNVLVQSFAICEVPVAAHTAWVVLPMLHECRLDREDLWRRAHILVASSEEHMDKWTYLITEVAFKMLLVNVIM